MKLLIFVFFIGNSTFLETILSLNKKKSKCANEKGRTPASLKKRDEKLFCYLALRMEACPRCEERGQ